MHARWHLFWLSKWTGKVQYTKLCLFNVLYNQLSYITVQNCIRIWPAIFSSYRHYCCPKLHKWLSNSITATFHYYTLCLRKKRGVKLFTITSSTVNRFWIFFHCWKQQYITYKINIIFFCHLLKTLLHYGIIWHHVFFWDRVHMFITNFISFCSTVFRFLCGHKHTPAHRLKDRSICFVEHNGREIINDYATRHICYLLPWSYSR